MNIAIFTHNYPRTSDDRKDAGTLIYDFAKILSSNNKVTILCPDFGGKKENYKKVKVKWIDYGCTKKFGNYSYFNPLDLFRLAKLFIIGCIEAEKLVKREKIDYIFCAWAIPSGIFTLYTKLKLKTPYGIWYLGSDLNIYGKMPIMSTVMRLIAEKADNLFANSHWLQKLATSYYKKECTFTPTSTSFQKKGIKTLRFDKKITNILFIGRLEKVKGPDILVEACRIASKQSKEFILRMIGTGTMKESLEEFIVKNKLTDKVKLLGDPGWYEKMPYVKGSDFLVVASRHESLPLVMIEVANFKLPIISSDVGDSKIVINKYLIGEVCKNNSPQDMAKKILDFVNSKKYNNIKKYGKFKSFVKDYSLENSVKIFSNKIINV